MAASADDEAALDALLSLTKLSKRKRTGDDNYDITEAEATAHRTANRARSLKEKSLPIPVEEKLAKQREQVRSDVMLWAKE